MISPFKAVLGDGYKSVEARLLKAIHIRFSLPVEPTPALSRLIKQADRASAWLEATRYAGFTLTEADKIFGRPQFSLKSVTSLVEPMMVEAAEAAFLERFHALEQD